MATPHRVGDLEIVENLTFQQKQWTVQRIGLLLMLLIVLLALAGLFGTGPLSSARVDSEDGALTVGYQRFVRHDGRSTLSIDIDGSQVTNDEVALWFSQDYLDAIEVEHISPQPKEVLVPGDQTIYVFALADPSATLHASVSLSPQAMGRLSGEAGLVDGPTVAFTQVSYP